MAKSNPCFIQFNFGTMRAKITTLADTFYLEFETVEKTVATFKASGYDVRVHIARNLLKA
jgi:ABC-type Na+ transport system ATPase subunit NatA